MRLLTVALAATEAMFDTYLAPSLWELCALRDRA